MSKNSDWLVVPIHRDVYPERIYQIAKKVGLSPDQIAENENVQRGRVVLKALPSDLLDTIIDIEECEENKNSTYVCFGDEEMTAILVMWPIKKLIRILDKFMQGTPKYRTLQTPHTIVQFKPSFNGPDED